MASDAEPPDAAGSGAAKDDDGWTRQRIRRLTARAVLALGVLCTLIGASIILACFINDRTISEARGDAVAEVVDTSLTRTVVRFSTDDGRIYLPPNGVLYPFGLQEQQMIHVEYDKRNPDLVRVAGYDAQLSFLPVLSSLAVVWAAVLLVHWGLRRPSAR